MALTVTSIHQQTSGNGHGTGGFTTTGFTPGSGRRVIVVAMAQSQADDAFEGSDLTISDSDSSITSWTSITNTTSSPGWAYGSRAWVSDQGASGSSMTVTIDAGAFGIENYRVEVFDVVDYGGTGGVQLRRVSHAYFGLTGRAQLEYLPVGVSMLPLQWAPKWPVALNANPQAGALRASLVPAAPFRPVDAPNPRGPLRAVSLRTHLSSLPLPFAVGPKPPLAFDLPNPRGRVPAISLRTFTNSLNTSTLAPPPGKPFAQYSWPVPCGRASTYYRSFVSAQMPPIPAVQLRPVGDPFMAARIQVPAKLPSEVRVETFDVSPFLSPGQSVSSAVGAIAVYSGTDPDYLDVLGTVSTSNPEVSVQLLGGVQGVIYILTIYVSAANPTEVIPVSFFLAIAPEMP